MSIIYKYPLEVAEQQYLNLPRDHKILCVQNQNESIQLWVLQDSDHPPKNGYVYVGFSVFGTGQGGVPANSEHIGTVQTNGGTFVWHVFQIIELERKQDG